MLTICRHTILGNSNMLNPQNPSIHISPGRSFKIGGGKKEKEGRDQ